MLQVTAATDRELQSLAGDLLSSGYTGLMNTDGKDQMTRFLVTHEIYQQPCYA